MIDTITFWVFLLVWPVWLGWELALLYWRANYHDKPKTISMVARDLGWKCSALVYLWAGCASHWWINGPTPATVLGSIIFWVALLPLLAADVKFWTSGSRAWFRHPALWLVVGALAGRFLFPQVAV